MESPSTAEIKKQWSYTSTTPYVFMAWCLISTRENFTFTEFRKRTTKTSPIGIGKPHNSFQAVEGTFYGLIMLHENVR
jgi:hypothetical protein